MIYDSIKHLEDYKHSPLLYEALSFLSKLPEGYFPEKGEVLNEKVLFFHPVTLTTKPEDDCKYEAHRKFIDLHYIIAGTERIQVTDLSKLTAIQEYSSDSDIGFYQGEADTCVDVGPGQFLLCLPHDAHKVAMMREHPEDVKKIVFKIRYDEYVK